MAQITYVKRAQVRWPMKPLLDEHGQPRKVALTRKDGSPKLTRPKPGRPGRPITRRLTVEDRSGQPLPNRKCGKCHEEILPGQPYKHISPRSGPRGGTTLFRCGSCPNWHVWEYSSSMGARLSQISWEFDQAMVTVESKDDVQAALDAAAESVEELAGEKRESAQNIEDGFGHPTEQSEELAGTADELDAWAQEISSASIPDFPEPEEEDCSECGGEETHEACDDPDCRTCNGTDLCDECGGTGKVTPDDPTEEQVEEWRETVQGELTIVDESPV